MTAPRVREAKDDDHYYGPWAGGSRSEGGHPGRLPTAAARRADMAKKVGPENVGVPPQDRKGAPADAHAQKVDADTPYSQATADAASQWRAEALKDQTKENGAMIDARTGEVVWRKEGYFRPGDAHEGGYGIAAQGAVSMAGAPPARGTLMTHTHPDLPGAAPHGLSDGDILSAIHGGHVALRSESNTATFELRPPKGATYQGERASAIWETPYLAAARKSAGGTRATVERDINHQIDLAMERMYGEHRAWIEAHKGTRDADVQAAIRIGTREWAKSAGYQYIELDRGGLMALPF